MIVLNPQGFSELSKHSGNPFLDAMTDLQGLFQTLAIYQQNKEYIDKYSDANLTDLKDKIKAMMPDAVDAKGNIDFSKIEALAGQGDPTAQSILDIKKQREAFANAPLAVKFNALKNPEVADMLSANIIDKNLKVKKKQDLVNDIINKSNLPDDQKAIFSAFSSRIAQDPQTLKTIIPLLISPTTVDNIGASNTNATANAGTNTDTNNSKQ